MESRLLTALANGEIESALRPAKEGMDDGLAMEIACFQSVANTRNGILQRVNANEVVFSTGDAGGKTVFVLDDDNPTSCYYIMDGMESRKAHIEFYKCMAAVVDCGEVILVAPRRFLLTGRNYRSELIRRIHDNPEFSFLDMNPPSDIAAAEMELYYALKRGDMELKKRSEDQVCVYAGGEEKYLILFRRNTSGDYMVYPRTNGGVSFVADMETLAGVAVLVNRSTGKAVLVMREEDLKVFD